MNGETLDLTARREAPTVLLVDDNPDFHLLWKMMIQMDGGFGTVVEATGGRAALEALETHRPDVVVTDCSMPDISGFEVIEAARSWCPGAVVVMASNTPDVGDEAVRRGASAFLEKYESTTEKMPMLIHGLLAEAQSHRLAPYEVRNGDTDTVEAG